jgi:tetratricopeptide (TPR) repeat protein
MAQADIRREGLSARMDTYRQHVETRRFGATSVRESGTRLSIGIRADVATRRPLYLHGRYYDRPDLIRYSDRHIYMYYDPYNRLHHRVIWPTYYYPVCYSFGSSWYLDYMWPYYHRKYLFVSLGGWWPYDYDYLRYYWYGYHPYVWYGYYPVAREVPVDGDNYYYTYNYYYGDDGTPVYSSDVPLDPVTQARLRAGAEQQRAAAPAPQTFADTRFDEGVKSFEAGDYAIAAMKFDEAMRLSPQDMILPFAYAQALFAGGQYDKAADVLREALRNVSPDKEGVFFPRGLYANDDVLFAQVEKLVDQVDRAENDADLQLLLGYQLLGIGETGYARETLEQAAQQPANAVPAGILLKVLDKMEKEAGSAVKAEGQAAKIQMPAPKVEVPNAETPAAVTVGEMMSGAAQTEAKPSPEPAAIPNTPVESVPPIPAGAAPLAAPQSKPEVLEKSVDTDKGSTTPANEPNAAPTPDTKQPPQANAEEDWVGAGPEGGSAPAVQEAGFVVHPAALTPGLSRLIGRHAPNVKADIVILAPILSLALAGVWIEWRFLGRYPA